MYTSCAGLRFTNQIWVAEIHQSHHHQPLLGILKTKDNLSVIDRINFDLADNFFVSMCANKKNLIFMTNRWFLGNNDSISDDVADWLEGDVILICMATGKRMNYSSQPWNWITLISVVFPFPAYEVLFLQWHVQQRSPFSAGGSWSWCDPTTNKSDCTHTIHNFDDTLLSNYVLVIGGPWAINYYIYQVILFQMYD